MGEGTRAADNAGEGLIVGRADNETSVIGDVGRVAAPIEAACGCDLKGSIVDGGRAVVGVVPGKRERAGAVFGQRSRAADDSREDLVTVGAKQEVAFVGDVVGTGSSRKSATNSVLWFFGDDMPGVPNKRGGGICIGSAVAPIFYNTMEDAGALPIELDVSQMNMGDVVELRPYEGKAFKDCKEIALSDHLHHGPRRHRQNSDSG